MSMHRTCIRFGRKFAASWQRPLISSVNIYLFYICFLFLAYKIKYAVKGILKCIVFVSVTKLQHLPSQYLLNYEDVFA